MRYIKGKMAIESDGGHDILNRMGYRPETVVLAEQRSRDRIAEMRAGLCEGCCKSDARCVCPNEEV